MRGQEQRPAEAPPSLQPTRFPPGRPLRRRNLPSFPVAGLLPPKADGNRRAMERSEVSCFSAAFSCTFLASCLLFSAFNRQQREAYMDEAFHVPQGQAYCAGRFQQVGGRPGGPADPRTQCRCKVRSFAGSIGVAFLINIPQNRPSLPPFFPITSPSTRNRTAQDQPLAFRFFWTTNPILFPHHCLCLEGADGS